jgi:hypothetical protein
MTGFESKRNMARDKLDDETDRLTIVYQSGFSDGKRSERKPLSATVIGNMMPSTIPMEYDGPLMEFARALEQAHNIKEQP